MQKKAKRNTAGIGVLVVVLLVCVLSSFTVLFGRMTSVTQTDFGNILSLTAEKIEVPASNAASSAPSAGTAGETTPSTSTGDASSASTGENAGGQSTGGQNSATQTGKHHPEFRMETDVKIFHLSYDNESGKMTVETAGGDRETDKLIAPGTSELYRFTLANPGDVALDYTLSIEAYITGTDLWIPVNVRVWDYTNRYLVGSADGMVDFLELDGVYEEGELAAGRYAPYYLEWEWPFERGEGDELTENDIYDTMLGDLAVDQDMVLHIFIRTTAEYDEEPENPSAGIPPKTGDDSSLLLFAVIGGIAFVGLCVMIIIVLKSRRNEKQAELAEKNEKSNGEG